MYLPKRDVMAKSFHVTGLRAIIGVGQDGTSLPVHPATDHRAEPVSPEEYPMRGLLEVFTAGPPSLRAAPPAVGLAGDGAAPPVPRAGIQPPGAGESVGPPVRETGEAGMAAAASADVTGLEHAREVALATVVTLEARAKDLREVIRGRVVIEQAKGLLMGTHRCDADRAWQLLAHASADFDVPVQDLALALTEAAAGQVDAPIGIATATALRAAMSPSHRPDGATGATGATQRRRGRVGPPPGALRSVDPGRLRLVGHRSTAD